MRTRAWRRAQRLRHIRNRQAIVKNVWNYLNSWQYTKYSGQLSKGNLTCRPRCGLCKPWKRWPGKTWDAKHPATRSVEYNCSMADVEIFQFNNCYVTVDSVAQRIETHYDDGSVAVGVPQDTEGYRQTARDLGYGEDIWAMTVDHELFHTVIAELRGDHHSGSLWAQAHKPDGFEFDTSKMPKKGQEEEERLFKIQRLLCKIRTITK